VCTVSHRQRGAGVANSGKRIASLAQSIMVLARTPLASGDGTEGQRAGDYLRARRQQIRPEDVGLVAGPRRRVAGLRREELATLAGISSAYYLRLEQGRDTRPSVQVVTHSHKRCSSTAKRRNICIDWRPRPATAGPDPQ